MSNSKSDKVATSDIVYKFDKHKRIIFGLVDDSYDDASSDDEYHSLQKGQIRVLWSDKSREEVCKQSKVRLLNRAVNTGHIVRRLEKGKETQRGYCKETKQICTVQIVGTDKVIEHVAGERLHRIRPYDIGYTVCLGTEFGRIENITQMISMQSKCGSIVEVMTNLNPDLEDYWLSKRKRESFDAYYPGQELICTPSDFEQPNWVRKSDAMKKNIRATRRFTVQNVEYLLIDIKCYNESGYSHPTQIFKDDIKNLSVLEHPSDTCLELSERRLLTLGAGDVLLKKKDWIRKLSASYRNDTQKAKHIVACSTKTSSRVPKIRSSSLLCPCTESKEDEWWTEDGEESDGNGSASSQDATLSESKKRHYPPKPRELVPGHTLPVEVICVESKITVVWQDGSEEKDIPSTQLYYSKSLDEYQFFPGEWVITDKLKMECEKYGVIQNVNYLERTACVKWFTYSDNEKKPKDLLVNEMSVYDLKKYTEFVFRPGSLVKSKPLFFKLGKVIDRCIEGYVHVQWLDGTEENCWPQDIELIPETDDYDSSDEETSDKDVDCVSFIAKSLKSFAKELSTETTLQNMARNHSSFAKELSAETTLQNMARRLDFTQNTTENFSLLQKLLSVYEDFSETEKSFGTSFFSLESSDFQIFLLKAKDKAKSLGVELKGRLFSSDSLCPSISKTNVSEKGNQTNFENKINPQIEKEDGSKEVTAPTTPLTTVISDVANMLHENLGVELLLMLKKQMNLAYAEIFSRVALSVLPKASENIPTQTSTTPVCSCPTIPDESFSALSLLTQITEEPSNIENESYAIIENAPVIHHFYYSKFEPTDSQKFLKAVQKEYKLLKESLPPGVWVKSYGNRIDLLSVMIRGPAKTPYEDGLFFFDIQLSPDYPKSPPLVHYISYSTESLNPNLYVEGEVCVSLLGTWKGRETEIWGPKSTLLQLIVSIQGLILVSEPYYNEAGYEKQTDTQEGYENSRTYNELVILKVVQSMTEMMISPPEIFKPEVYTHFAQNGQNLCDRLNKFCSETDPLTPEFPLLPISKGLKLTLSPALNSFQKVLKEVVADSAVKKSLPSV